MTHHANDDWFPLEAEEHRSQVHAVLSLLGPAPKRVIDVGAGGGRLAGPLVDAGHTVLALDRDDRAGRACEALGATARVVDVTDPDAAVGFEGGPADAAVMLGGTLMELVDPLAALGVFRALRRAVVPGGWLAVDGSLTEVWDDVAEGAWVTGVSEDGLWQMIWAPGDAVLALRRGDEVDPDDWEIGPGDRLVRLWSLGALRLLAEAAGWGAPETVDFRTLLRFERPG